MTRTLVSPTRSSARFRTSELHERARPARRPPLALRNAGWICVAAALALSLLGAAVLTGTTHPAAAPRHLAHLVVGIIAATMVALPHYRHLRDLAWPLLGAAILLLVFVLIPFVPEEIVRPRNGARRWINLYVTDLQPSELAKTAWVIALAAWLRYRSSYRRLRGLLPPLALTLVPMALILLEPDLGTALLFLPVFFAMLIAAGAKLRHLALIITLGLGSAPMLYPVLQPHQKDRIKAMAAQVIGDDTYVNDIGYQGARARMLVGAGGTAGVGKQRAQDLVRYNRLPEDHNDMIFAVICCRWGALGAALTWALFAALIGGGVLVAAWCRDPFGRLAAVGLVSLFFVQMAINSGMTIGLLPITGLTLPFVSAGGSSMLSAWLMVGILVNIAMRRPPYMLREPFDFDAREEP